MASTMLHQNEYRPNIDWKGCQTKSVCDWFHLNEYILDVIIVTRLSKRDSSYKQQFHIFHTLTMIGHLTNANYLIVKLYVFLIFINY